ncbi:hypothetical protein CYY_004517 [Polysphondylium violaceum]|uniref:HEPN domain-containing protein n=2 Tax=Polysphondylium violaceum TaxID=133409 RepID=A0A8J4PWH1_9MYCE|nr:hypothetical protein CYY_004517 [Polysphondylium violaceum]
MNIKFKDGNAVEPYYKRINGILKKYHESTILKELLQNADDAGATKVIIKYDSNSYPTDNLCGNTEEHKNNMKELQGPSILVYNNSIFEEKDWDGIRSLGSGSKEMDLKSVGKFGLGVNSVYHVSDYLTIVSNQTLLIQDPLTRVSDKGLFVNFVEQPLNAFHPNTTAPFKHFGCDMVGPFKGTIMRLPIRSKSSLIRQNPVQDYDPIFKEFIHQLEVLLLFLKNIAMVEVYHDEKLDFRVSLTNSNLVSAKRKLVHQYVSRIADSMMEYDIGLFMEIIMESNDLPLDTFVMDLKFEGPSTRKSSYCVTQGLVKKGLEKLRVEEITTKLIPWGGVAVPLGLTEQEMNNFQGIPFTFLPIGSLKFKIPFHFNGFFILSDARTDILFSSTTLENSEEYLDSKWNENMLTNIVPELYERNLQYMIEEGIVNHENSVYRYFPSQEYVTEKDKLLSSSTLKRLSLSKLFQDATTLQYYNLHQSHCFTELNKEICDIVHQRSVHAVKIPPNILEYLQDEECFVKLITPTFICSLLKEFPLFKYSDAILEYLINAKTISSGVLDGLNIFPMADGTLSSVQIKSKATLHLTLYPDQKQFSLLKARFSNSMLDYNKMKNFEPFIDKLVKFYHFQRISHEGLIVILKRIFKEMVGNNILSSLPEEFSSDLFWQCIENQETHSISNFICIPAQCKDSSTVYVASGHPKLLLDSMPPLIQKMAIKLGFLITTRKNVQHSLAVSCIDSFKNFVKELDPFVVSIQNGQLKNDLRKFILSQRNSIELSKKIFSLPIFNNSNNGFSSIHSSTICTSWKDIHLFSRKQEYVVFEETKDFLLEWPTQLFNQNDMILKYILPNMAEYPLEDRHTIVKMILQNFDFFSKQKTFLGQMVWVPNSNGTLSKISDLVILEPQQEKLLKYTPNGLNRIISPQLSEGKSDTWLSFGVKNRYSTKQSPEFDLVHDCLVNLPISQTLDLKSSLFDITTFMFRNGLNHNRSLLSIKCIPVKKNLKIGTFNQTLDQLDQYISMSECYLKRHKELIWTVGKVGDIDEACLHQISLPNPSVELVFQHLENLIESETESFSDQDRNSMDCIIEKIYTFLNSKSDKDLEPLSEMDWIWTGAKFVPSEVAFVKGLSIDPYIFPVPTNLVKFSFLYQNRIPDAPNFTQYSFVLKEIYKKSKGVVLSDVDLEIAIKVTEELSKVAPPEDESFGKLYFPTTRRTLVNRKKIIFSETNDIHPSLKNFSILHRSISPNVAKHFEIKSSSDAIKRGKLIYGSNFGQSEDIITRIRNINEEYPVESFLKEMVQNAEDSKSTVLEILLDKRRYKIIKKDDEVPRQFLDYLEPSLVIFNDSKFTDSDIENIQILGDSFKRTDTSKVGHYGIGFNSVYNFTNVPSFVTRDSLFVFDPLRTHFSVEESPGRSYQFGIAQFLKDTFQPLNYPNFGLSLDKEYQHTIIRLPLRKKPSRLNHKIWTLDSVSKIIEDFKATAENCLLFQRNLKKISFSVIEDDGTHQSKTLFTIEKKIKEGSFDPKDLFSVIENFNWNGSIDHFSFFETISLDESNQWFVGWMVGTPANSGLHSLYKNLKDKIVPLGSIAVCLNKSIKGIPFTFLPLPKSTELPIHVNGSFILNSSRQDVFNSLENTFEVAPNKIPPTPDTEQGKSFWNILIVQELIGPLYLKVLSNKEFQSHFTARETINHFYSLFPQSEATLWNRITEYFYKHIFDYSIFSKLSLSNTNNEISYSWNTIPMEALVIESDFSQEYENMEIIEILLQDKANLFLVPQLINLKLPAKKPSLLSPSSVSKIYQAMKGNFVLSNPPAPSLSKKENIIALAKYVTSRSLENTPFKLLENEKNCLTFIKTTSPKKHIFNQEYFDLLPNRDLFIHSTLCKKVTIKTNPYFENEPVYALNLSFPKFFVTFLVPHLRSLKTIQECTPILQSLHLNWAKFDIETKEQLKELPIIPVLKERSSMVINFNKVSKYYNSELLKIFKPKYLVPTPFNTAEYEPTLCELGLRRSPKITTIKKHFAALVFAPNESNFIKLYRYLRDNFSLSQVQDVLESIKNHEIVPCTKIDRIGAIDLKFSSLSKSSNAQNEDLCFTVLPIRKIEIQENNIMDSTTIVNHLYNVIKDSAIWKKQEKLGDLSSLLLILLQHIGNNQRVLPLPEGTMFPINCGLVPLKDIILTYESYDLDPLFYTIPKDFFSYSRTLERLGFKYLDDQRIILKITENVDKVFGQSILPKFIYLLKLLRESEPPALLDKSYCLKPAQVIYRVPIDNTKLEKRISATNVLFQVHPEIEAMKKFKINTLSSLIKESLNSKKSSVVQVSSLVDFSKDEIIEKIESQLVEEGKSENKTKIINQLKSLKVFKGNLVSKFTVISNNQDVTIQESGSDYIYDDQSNCLYIQKEKFDYNRFCLFIQLVFGFMIIACLYGTEEAPQYDDNPFHSFLPGDQVFFRNDQMAFVPVTVVHEIENQGFSELKFYFIKFSDDEEPEAHPSIRLFKQGTTDYTSIQMDTQAVRTLYEEVHQTYGEGPDCQRVKDLAKNLNVVLTYTPTNQRRNYFKEMAKQLSQTEYIERTKAQLSSYTQSSRQNQFYARIFKLESEQNLKLAKHCHTGNFFAAACFNTQQCLEKLFKAYSFSKGISFIKNSHNILFFNFQEYFPNFDVTIFNNFYIETRYPSLSETDKTPPHQKYSHKDSQIAIDKAQEIFDHVYPLIQ